MLPAGVVMFERYMVGRKEGGNHCHINVIPVPKVEPHRRTAPQPPTTKPLPALLADSTNPSREANAESAEQIFTDSATANGFEFEHRLGPAGGTEAAKPRRYLGH